MQVEPMAFAMKTLEAFGGKRILNMMISATSYMYNPNEMQLSFRFTSRNALHANHLKLTQDKSNNYILEFGRIYGKKYSLIKTLNDIHIDKLTNIFESETKLVLKYRN